jgi:hypothetical protein
MDQNTTALERAFQLANSGDFDTIKAIRSKLKAEGYPISQIVRKSLINQLRRASCSISALLNRAGSCTCGEWPRSANGTSTEL